MGLLDDVLEEFDGQLSIDEIYHLTYKELGYLRKHRREKIKARNRDLEEGKMDSKTMKKMSKL